MKSSNKIVLIFGSRSNLSKKLSGVIPNSMLIKTSEILDNKIYLEKYNNYDEIDIIINSFYPAQRLNNLSEPFAYIKNSVYLLACLFEQIKNIKKLSQKIRKIIYTSSASVYGNNNYCSENDILNPLNLHASLKLSSEKMIEEFCKKLEIDYTICRLFNMYGGDDKFSIIIKIVNSVLTNQPISLINNGTAIRDFIHIDDIVNCYDKILNIRDCNIINIASGDGISIKTILDNLELKGYKINIKNINRDEIKVSTANTKKLNFIINTSKFYKVINYIEESLSRSNK